MNYKTFLFYILVLSLITSLYSCNKEDSLGLDLMPQKDLLNLEYCDTFSLQSYSFVNDTLFDTKNNTYSLIGSYIDPVFGYSQAGFLTQIRLSSENIEWGVFDTLVSLHLSLVVSESYGDITEPMTIKVYESLKEINSETDYVAFDESEYINDDSFITSYTFTPSENGQDTLIDIEFPLDFSDRIMQYITNAEFLDFFRGLYLTVDSQNVGGSISYLNLLSDKSVLNLEYKEAGIDTIKVFRYLINSNCQRKNVFTHKYSGTEIEQGILQKENAGSNFIQSMRGVSTIIETPYLKDFLSDNTVAITKAELIINENQNYVSDEHPACERLMLKLFNDTLAYINLPDYGILGSDYFSSEYSDNSYTFNITGYIQGLVSRDLYDDYKLFLFSGDNSTSSNRVVINSASSDIDPIKLKIYYLKL